MNIASQMSFGKFWLKNEACLRLWVKRKEKAKRQWQRRKGFNNRIESILKILLLYLERPLYSFPVLIDFIIEGKSRITKAIIIVVAYVASVFTCSYVLFPLLGLGWLSGVIQFYVSDNHPSDELKNHIAQLCGQRQTLYDLYWVTNQNIVIKICLILFTGYLLVILLKVIVDQLVHIILGE